MALNHFPRPGMKVFIESDAQILEFLDTEGNIKSVKNVNTPVSNFEYETRVNEGKRSIQILNPEYVSLIDSDMRNMMKYMIYFAPIMMMVFFNNYSSGLSLYYFVSNLLSIAIMFTIKNYILDERKIRQQIQFNKSQPVKPPSRFQRRMQAIMEEAERQKKNK